MKKEIKVAWFSSNAVRDYVLTTNGVALDRYCTKCIVTEDFGNYVLDATFTIDAQDYLEEEDILKVRLDYGDEIFRISKVTKSTRYIDIVARQITIAESLTLYLDDVRPTNLSGQGALSHMYTNAQGTKEIILQSNITSASTAYYQDMSLYKALHDSDNSFITRWGGECLRRQYTLSINTSIGADRNVVIRERKNLTGFSGTSNIDDLVTRARGKGSNGILGSWIDSPLKGNYARVYTRTIEYQDVKVKGESDTDGFATEALAKTELDKRIKAEFSNNDIDKLKATYTINFVQLEQTEEYKNYVAAERVYLGDTIRVYVPRLKTDIKVRAIARKYNVLAKKVDEITLSNAITLNTISMNSIISDLKNQYANTNNNSIASYIDAIIKAGMKDSYLVVRANELLVMDTKDINTAINVTRFNKNGLGFSHSGYYGHYDYGFTSDGKINASLISTGILTAILIKSTDGSCFIDLSTGEINFNKGKIQGLNSSWNLDTGIFETTGIWEGFPCKIKIGSGQLFSDGIFRIANKPLHGSESSILMSYDNTKSGINISSDDITLLAHSGIVFHGGTSIYGSFEVHGDKKCIQTTKTYGKVPFYANEDFNSLLTLTPIEEIHTTKYYEETKAYKCIVKIDEITKECINTDMDYNVWFSKLGPGDLWVANTYPSYFIMESDREINFKCKVEGRRKNFEDRSKENYLESLYKNDKKKVGEIGG